MPQNNCVAQRVTRYDEPYQPKSERAEKSSVMRGRAVAIIVLSYEIN